MMFNVFLLLWIPFVFICYWAILQSIKFWRFYELAQTMPLREARLRAYHNKKNQLTLEEAE